MGASAPEEDTMSARDSILVTGASGRLGGGVVRELLAHGYAVRGIDQRRPDPATWPSEARFIETSLHDIGQIAGAMQGCAAVIHLGAIPAPYSHPDEVVFTNNTTATFSVLQAMSILGIRRAAIASSGSIYGTAWSRAMLLPQYVPLDEEHPILAADPYALAKETDERTAAMFVRKDGSTIAALRFHWVALPEELRAVGGTIDDDPDSSTGVRGIWGYVHIDDAARACRLAIEAEPFGFAAFNIVASDTTLDIPTEEALARFAPSIARRTSLPGFASGYAIDKAKRLLGWEPLRSWRDEMG